MRKDLIKTLLAGKPSNRKCAFTLAEGATHVALFTDKRRSAFTLAEVLITLGIIGIVAALTLPTLINKYQEKATITKVKKFYSLISQGYQAAVNEYGTPDNWGMSGRFAIAEDDFDSSVPGSVIMRDIILKNAKVVKRCDNPHKQQECGAVIVDASQNRSGAAAKLADGTTVLTLITSGGCSYSRGNSKMLRHECGWIRIDVNGKEPPNASGNDIFNFYLTKYGIVPVGTSEETSWVFDDSSGHGKTAWVIMKENMDYLRCPEKLGWDKGSSCK